MALTQDEHTRVLVRGGVSEREYRDYMNACLTGDTAVEKGLERYLIPLFTPRSTEPFVPAEIYEEFVLPLLNVKGRVFRPVVVALSNPNCPPEILFAACTSSRARYVRSAGLNPNCPDEGRVIFALTPNPLGIVGAEGGSLWTRMTRTI